MQELTIIEQSVLELIPRGGAVKRSASEIASLVGLERRDIQAVVNRLVKKGVPIVAKRDGRYIERGYYIATTEEERTKGLISLKRQQKDTEERIKLVEHADLKNWENNLKRAVSE
ncbi:hypothetical protein [Enterococcus italicus]|uniref:Helix-turn-helix type 11 domain-containing protein n=1 Tax=Enterococcus italicus (strain DSM 15952 / CCUG 50447 / LMG 22039 / TP 1.5) TaxID=888064 RepID=E6LEM6_ENTI1|nr:hypothetical protein [Enterococcus italicus]EFU74339.1 hypothetical protein HMPREF9088_0816 [Enterococcus italicus DSM 15952]